ncbi:MAG: tyrosine-type recombinase/integrase [Bacteroidetes bacterium]|nr:tyrosine-type recombinase/integrase [Bacteroidota bacterium]
MKEDRIEIFQKKVSKKVIVPICTDPLIALLKKYKNKPPHFESITEFNRLIRDICETAKITEQVTMLRTNATVKKEVVSRKFELVSSHTCRRSFCTNHFLNGMPVTLIMAISGHKTERAFMRYLKIDNSKKVDMFRENMERRKAGK